MLKVYENKSLPKEKPEHFYFYGINLINPTTGASENEIIEFEITSFNIADNLHAKIDYEELYYSDAPTWLKILYLKLSNAPCIKKTHIPNRLRIKRLTG